MLLISLIHYAFQHGRRIHLALHHVLEVLSLFKVLLSLVLFKRGRVSPYIVRHYISLLLQFPMPVVKLHLGGDSHLLVFSLQSIAGAVVSHDLASDPLRMFT